MHRKPFSLSRRSTARPPRRNAFRPRLEIFETRTLLSANVLAYHNGGPQTGVNPNETVLTPSNVNSAEFGKLFDLKLDGQVFAQPLYVSGLSIPGQGTHNVVFVATENDSVYAFDADTGSLVWHDSFIDPAAGVTAVPTSDLPASPAYPVVGITSAPVIDQTTNTLYVVAFTKEVSGSSTSYVYRLHALNVTTGAEKFRGPVAIQAEDNGTGVGNDGSGHVVFDARQQDQRVGLLLLNGVVYFGFASYGDIEPYHGWLLGYNAQTLKQAAVFDDTPNGSEGGIWMSQGSPATDGTYIYLSTGNGTFDTTLDANGFPAKGDYGDAYIKLAADPSTSPTNQNSNGWGLKVVDYFTPYNQQSLAAQDLDVGSSGLTVLPDQTGPYTHELVGSSKDGTIYVIDRDNMGKFNSTKNNIIQEIDNQLPAGGFDTPAYFNGQVYFGGQGENLKAYQVTNGLLANSPTSQSGNTLANHGATSSISANGTADGVVSAQENPGGSKPAVLYAYDATNLSVELYNSSQVASRDQAGLGINFVPPIIANGKVFVATADELDVYGLLPPIIDAGFEQPAVGAGRFEYNPTSSAWKFAGSSGIAGNDSGFTSGNPPAPQGLQVAFLQGSSSITQTATGWAAGAYVITFDAAQRANLLSHQNFNVLVDGIRRGHLHTIGHVLPELLHGRVHRERRPGYDHVPGFGQCRGRQHRLPRRPRSDAGRPPINRRRRFRARGGGGRDFPVRPHRLGMGLLGHLGHLRQRQRLHLGQFARAAGGSGRFPSANRNDHAGGDGLGGWFLRDHLRRRPAPQLPECTPELQRAGRRQRREHLHSIGHIVPELLLGCVHRHRGDSYDHLPRIE